MFSWFLGRDCCHFYLCMFVCLNGWCLLGCYQGHFVASELKDPFCHSDECQIGSFSSEATTCICVCLNVWCLLDCDFSRLYLCMFDCLVFLGLWLWSHITVYGWMFARLWLWSLVYVYACMFGINWVEYGHLYLSLSLYLCMVECLNACWVVNWSLMSVYVWMFGVCCSVYV